MGQHFAALLCMLQARKKQKELRERIKGLEAELYQANSLVSELEAEVARASPSPSPRADDQRRSLRARATYDRPVLRRPRAVLAGPAPMSFTLPHVPIGGPAP
jgi:hypothetical protein